MDKRISKQASNREKNATFVASSLRIHGPAILGELGRRLFPAGVPADVNLAKLLEALASAIDRDTTALRLADEGLIAELSDDQPARDTRDLAVAALRAELMDAASYLNGAYGFDLATTYNLGGETPDNPDLLVKRAKATVELLRTKPITASPLPGRAAVDPAALALAIEAKCNALEAALAEVLEEAREYQLALAARDHALETWSRSYVGAAGVAHAFYTLAGSDALAAVVRPTSRRVAGDEVIVAPPEGTAVPTDPGAAPTDPGATPTAGGTTKSSKRKAKKKLTIPS